ncbi:cadherin-23-like [Amphiura filiformis]|uniref:cadherin-23-like n=1 Tax=Amphiura filiformis TaxID=82378 RepID=UPI003B21506E
MALLVFSSSNNAYQCICTEGWLGTLCDIDNPCLPNPCQNAATCALNPDNVRSYSCNCQVPYIGTLCQNIDRCIPDPCLNGGICSTRPDGALHICRCPTQWAGYNCQDPNYCGSDPCQNGGVCVPNGEGTGYLCNCPTGYSGDNCEARDPCNSSPCLNGGRCLNSNDRNSFLCDCSAITPVRYYGIRCGTIDPCASSPCFNGAPCEAINDGLEFRCRCPDYFYGDRCEIYDPCSSSPCVNGGVCETSITGSYTCRCPSGFSGLNCEISESCNPSPCLNGGTCLPNVNSQSGYTCLCSTGYYGTQCGNIDLCSFQPCQNGGTCTFDAGSGSFTCTCPPGFYGDNCSGTNPCTGDNPCQNGGICIADGAETAGYRCNCQRGFLGPNCENVCQGFACANGQCIYGGIACDGIQHCADASDESECSMVCGVRCDAGTKCLNASKECNGVQECADNTDELGCESMCKPNPCYNGGLCTEVLNDNNVPDFECRCTPGYCGKDCRDTSGEGVNCVNQPPVFELPDGLTLIFQENTAIGTPLFQLQASDPDNDTLTYSLYDSVAQSLFTIDPLTGQLYLKAILDRETQQRYTYIVAVSDGRNTVTQEGTFTASDVNDNAPTFRNLPHTVRIPENAAFGEAVYKVSATDPDTSAGGLVTFSIVNNSVPFSIGLFDGQITVSAPLDYEMQPEYQLFINSRDLGMPSFNSTEILTVIIEDIQDSGPIFINEPYDTSIEEGIPIGTPVVTVVAVDKDTVNQNPIIYDIITGNEGGFFSLNQNNGDITVVQILDKDSPTFPEQITFTIRATEIGLTGEADITEDFTNFTITVTDIQDEPPVFNSQFYIVTVSEENLPGYALPIEINVNDGDKIIDQAFSIRVEPSNGPFVVTPTTAVGQATLQVNLRQQLDYETTQTHQFQIVATEETGPNPLTASSTVQVVVLDANDNDPIFEGPIGAVNINEGVMEGYEIITVTANDLDTLDVNTEIRYSIVAGNHDNLFRIDEVTGTISINVPELDFEEAGSPQYILTIEATNTADPVLPARGSTQMSLTVNIINLNDNAPIFDPADYTIGISEITEPGLTIDRVVAYDPDPGPAGDVLYYIVAGNDGTFELDPDNGEIQLIERLDRESKSSYLLTVQAQDQGNPVLSSRTTVQIDVRDFNDNDPQWSPQSYAVNVREGQPADTFVIQVSATDADTGVNAQLVFEINPANDCFQINRETGQITTTKPLDREEDAEHVLSVTVRDRGNPQRSASRPATVTVTVTDVNDSPPSFVETEYVYEIMENLPAGTQVGQLTATDPDSTGTLYYEFDPILSDFTVIANTGFINTNRRLDRERQADYNTTARVRDGARVDTARVRIIVLDANDHAPSFNASAYIVQVYENSPVPTEVIRLVANDDDAGAFGRVTYRFVDGSNSQGPFSIINPTMGVITTSTQLDYEQQQSYTIYIEARDGGTGNGQLSGATSVIVNVLDVNDNGPRFPDNSYTESVAENVDENFVIIQLVANDRDSSDTGPAMYRIIQGNSNGTFVIDPLTGEITRVPLLLTGRQQTPIS